MKHLSLSILSLGLAVALGLPALADTLKKPELDQLAAAQQAKSSPSFRAFLAQAAKADPKLKAERRGLREEDAAGRRRPGQHRAPARPLQPPAQPEGRDREHRDHGGDADGAHRPRAAAREQGHRRVRPAGREDGARLRPAVPQRRQPHLRGQAAGPRQGGVRHPHARRRGARGALRMGAGRRHAARPLQGHARGRLPLRPRHHRRQGIDRGRALRDEGGEGERPAAGPHHPPDDRDHRRNRRRRDEVLPREDAAARIQHRARQQVPGGGGGEGIGRAQGPVPGGSL